jgi:hypothetical protein
VLALGLCATAVFAGLPRKAAAFEVSIRARYMQDNLAGQGFSLVGSVRIPLDDFGRDPSFEAHLPRRSMLGETSESDGGAAAKDSGAESGETEAHAAEEPDESSDPGPAPQPKNDVEPIPTQARVAVFDAEFVGSLVQRALVRAGFGRELSRLDDLSGRARTSALLPEVSFRAGRSQDASNRLSPTDDQPYRVLYSGTADLWFEGRLTFKLRPLVFASEELSLERLRLQEHQARARHARVVIDALLRFQRAAVGLAEPLLPPDEQFELLLVCLEARLELDWLTGGWFSEQVPRLPASPLDAPAP